MPTLSDSPSSAQVSSGKKVKIDLSGQRFGRLIAVVDVGRDARSGVVWLCRCDCGGETRVSASDLRRGKTQSCGCLHRERFSGRTHGETGSQAYTAWQNMRRRCRNEKGEDWPLYGGRGIRVCQRWSRFENFLVDMGEPPEGASLDRIDTDGHYEPGNCRWASSMIQQRNKRNNRLVKWRGKTQTLADWADELAINYWTLHARFKRGWTIERALGAPLTEGHTGHE